MGLLKRGNIMDGRKRLAKWFKKKKNDARTGDKRWGEREKGKGTDNARRGVDGKRKRVRERGRREKKKD